MISEFDRLLKCWHAGSLSLDEQRNLAAEIGNDHVAEGVPVLMEMLRNSDAIVRYNAVNSLAFELHYQRSGDAITGILVEDKDGDCRRVAAAALGALYQRTSDRRVMRFLASSSLHDPEDDVRVAAYKALLIVRGLSPEEHLRTLLEKDTEVDSADALQILNDLNRTD